MVIAWRNIPGPVAATDRVGTIEQVEQEPATIQRRARRAPGMTHRSPGQRSTTTARPIVDADSFTIEGSITAVGLTIGSSGSLDVSTMFDEQGSLTVEGSLTTSGFKADGGSVDIKSGTFTVTNVASALDGASITIEDGATAKISSNAATAASLNVNDGSSITVNGFWNRTHDGYWRCQSRRARERVARYRGRRDGQVEPSQSDQITAFALGAFSGLRLGNS